MIIVVAETANGISRTTTKDGIMTTLFSKRKFSSALFVFSSFTFPISAGEIASPDKDRYVIRFTSGASVSSPQASSNNALALSVLSGAGVIPIKSLPKHNVLVATLNRQQLALLKTMPEVEAVEIDPVRYISAQTIPYGISLTQSDVMPAFPDSGVKVCVIDTGYALGHPDLPGLGEGLTGESNTAEAGNWYQDGHGHGTHVAGTVAAINNEQGVVGAAPGVGLHIVKIFADDGQWTYSSDLLEGISQCQDAGADVVNMSLGGYGATSTEEYAMRQFAREGMLLVAAAGNDGISTPQYPASYDDVISVAAVREDERWAPFSQHNYEVEIAAPGLNVLSTYPGDQYAFSSGTSMASPHVSAIAARLWNAFPECSNATIREALTSTAKDKGRAGRDPYFGYGIVQGNDAYSWLAESDCESVTPPPGIDPVTHTYPPFSLPRNRWLGRVVDVPEGARLLRVSITGGTGDADLYVDFGQWPTAQRYQCRPFNGGNEEVCEFPDPQAGRWYMGLNAYLAFFDVELTYHYE